MYFCIQIGSVSGPEEHMIPSSMNSTQLCRPTDVDPQREMIAAYAGLFIMFVMAVFAMYVQFVYTIMCIVSDHWYDQNKVCKWHFWKNVKCLG
jgi:hypothetical protein